LINEDLPTQPAQPTGDQDLQDWLAQITPSVPVVGRIVAEKVVPDGNGNMVKTGEKQVSEDISMTAGEASAFARYIESLKENANREE
jgi:hypothetical protein